MKTAISEEQIAFYRQNGFVVQEDFLRPDEVEELKSAVLETVASMGTRRIADEGAPSKEKDGYYKAVFTQRINLWKLNATIKRYMLESELGEMVGKLAGVDEMRVWHDQALIKEPYGNPTAWHLDNPYWSFYSRDAISVWIALEDATLENGCMYYIPTTQKTATFKNVGIGKNLGALFEVYPDWKKIAPVALPLKAGSCGFHNGLTAHAAAANMTHKRRIAMTCAYMPGGSTFNGQQNILSVDYVKTLKEGDILNNEAQNPVVFSKEN